MRETRAAYDMDYFIRRYKSMPNNFFTLTDDPDGASDAWEWLTLEESIWLYNAIKDYGLLICVNDGYGSCIKYGDTIKERVVNFLEYVKEARLRKYETAAM